jgi:PAS domain S-box-containing protein
MAFAGTPGLLKELRVDEAEAVLTDLARVFFRDSAARPTHASEQPQSVESRFRALVEQIPAVVFMAYLDEAVAEAYVSPHIERALGFSQREWLEDPVRWYRHLHPEDKDRWNVEAARMFLTGDPLRSSYRVLARDGRTIWFHCEANMMRRDDGRPWFIHGVAFDITQLKSAEAVLEKESSVLSAILDSVAALVAVLDAEGRIVRFNRACERVTGFSFAEVHARRLADMFVSAEDAAQFQAGLSQIVRGIRVGDSESALRTRDGESRLISWSMTTLPGTRSDGTAVLATGVDVTERKRLERAVLEVSSNEQRRIGQDLHDGLGQHLTGIAFMSKALEQKLADQSLPEAVEAARIVKLVNDSIQTTRKLARGLHPVISDAAGLTSALRQLAGEVQDVFQVICQFRCDEPVLIARDDARDHLYRIAQEAIHNAIRHGKAKHLSISLTASGERGTLEVSDDGTGFTGVAADHRGMGLNIMRYRAGMIGGLLTIARGCDGGTTVTCVFPK